MTHDLTIIDDVRPDPVGYRTALLAHGGFHDIEMGPVTFRGIAFLDDFSLPAWIAARFPQLTPTRTVLRRSPAGQVEPHYIHEDRSMGDWSGIFYLTPNPPAEDGTKFYRHIATGQIASTARDDDERLREGVQWQDPAQWDSWQHVHAKFNRLLIFPSAYYHSRALVENYGTDDDARLIQLVFGTGSLVPEGVRA